MISIGPTQKIYIGLEALDFRAGFNSTAGACRRLLQHGSHLDGGLFVFTNKNFTMIRCYQFDGHGELLLTKRIAKGRFRWWLENPERVHAADVLAVFAGNGPLKKLPKLWKEIA